MKRDSSFSRDKQTRIATDLQRGLALQQAGRDAEATSLYQQVLSLDPWQAGANHLLGLIRLKEGDAGEAVRLISRSVRSKPNDAQYLSNLGVALTTAGNLDQAVAVLRRAAALGPEVAEVHANLGRALRALRRFDEAISACREAIRLKPQEAGFYFNLANALNDAGFLRESQSAYRRTLLLRPLHAGAISALANSLALHGSVDEGLALVDEALQQLPNSAQLHLRRARCLQHQRHLELAAESYERAVALDPNFGEAHLQLSYMRREHDDREVAAMDRLFNDTSVATEHRVFAGFGLGRALSDRGEHIEAIDTYKKANRLNGQRAPHSADRAIAQLSEEALLYEEMSRTISPVGESGPGHIFVVGLPRSGKTSVEAILSRHPAVAGAGELPTLGRLAAELVAEVRGHSTSSMSTARLAELGRAYSLEAQSFVPEGKVLVDTMPTNFRRVGLIRMAMPNARIVWCHRPLPDNCIAIFEKLFTSGGFDYAHDIETVQAYYLAQRRLMDAVLAADSVGIFPIDISNFHRNRRAAVGALLSACGLDWSEACLADDVESEPRLGHWSTEQVSRNRSDHLAAWRNAHPELWT